MRLVGSSTKVGLRINHLLGLNVLVMGEIRMRLSKEAYRQMVIFAGAGITALSLASSPTFAQQAGASQAAVSKPADKEDEKDDADKLAEVVVTGSRIRRDEFSTVEPITVITKQEITQGGFASTTDALQSTAVTAGSAQINNYYGGFVVNGGTGVNTLGLRNLGPARTLVLLNGRRLSPAGTRGAVLAADLNVLPTAIVDRIEILKAGASSIYGSDAIAGVVNIMTDKSTRGFTLDAQVNVPDIGVGLDKRYAATFGFGNERLDVIGSIEYRSREAVRQKDKDWFMCPRGGFLTGEGTAFGSGDTAGFDGSTCWTLDNGGVTINTLGVPSRLAFDRASGAVGSFNRLVPDASVTTGNTPGFKGVTFYSRDTFSPAMAEEEIVTPVETHTGFLQGTYDLQMLGNAEAFVEALATRRISSSALQRQLSIDYLRGSPLVPTIFRDGLFLSPNSTSSGQFVAARAFVDFGLTKSEQEVDYIRAGGGIRGDFIAPDWRYEAYVGKSWTNGQYEIESFLIDRMANSLLVTQNANGSFSCASIAINSNCVAAPPLNADTIGGRLPQAWRDYILQNTIGLTKFIESTVTFIVDGPAFDLPAGSVKVALGGEYRAQEIDDTPDQNSLNGNLLGLTSSVPTRGKDSVQELFGEVFVPVRGNLTLNASIRHTDYESYGSDQTYKVAAEWIIAPSVGLRSSYGTSYRAPALAEQFLGATSGFGSGNGDPCDADNFPVNPASYTPTQRTIAANCAKVGIDVLTFQQTSSITIFNRGGAETGLSAETSTNWSAGLVIRPAIPEALGSLSIAVDYFDIKVENGVSLLSSGNILSRCYTDTAFDPAGGFCRFVKRDTNKLLQVTSGYVNLTTNNVKGWELTSRFATDAVGSGRLVLNTNITKYNEQSNKIFPEEFLLDSNGTTTRPEWVGRLDATYSIGRAAFRYGVEWVEGSSGTYNFFAKSRSTGLVDQALAQTYRNAYRLEVDSYFVHSASLQVRASSNIELTVGARNLFNKRPPEISNVAFNTVGNTPLYSGYDIVGRTFFANASYKF